MPFTYLAAILAAVVLAGAVTVWLFSMGGTGVTIAALPAVLLAALAIRVLCR